MALTTCKECGKEISDTAKACPGCGAKTEYSKEKTTTIRNSIIAGGCSLIVIVLIAILYFSTSGGKPADMNQEVYNIGKDVVRIADRFIDGEIDKEEANDKIDNLQNQLKSIELTEDEKISELGVSIDSISVSSDIYFKTVSEAIDSRNKLAKSLNMKAR